MIGTDTPPRPPSRFEYFEVVRAAETDTTRSLGIAGDEGVVLGMSYDDETTRITMYSVGFFDTIGYSVSMHEDDLTSTGRFVPRDEIYDGSSIRVSLDGEVLPPPAE